MNKTRKNGRNYRTGNRPPDANGVFRIYGLPAATEYFKFASERVMKITANSRQRDDVLKCLEQVASTNLGSLVEIDDEVADLFIEVKHPTLDEESFLAALSSNPVAAILALDHVTDPRNLGAIVRSAAFFGVKYVLVPQRRQVLLTDVSAQTAQGGFALVELAIVSNLGRVLEKLKTQGYWIIGTAMGGEPLEKVAGFYHQICIILGAEDKGMSQGITSKCDRIVAIETHAAAHIESLNVSVAAGIVMAALTSKEKRLQTDG